MKKANHASLMNVESSHYSKTKEIIEVKDRRVKVRVTMDSGAARHVIPETMFPRVKLERKTSPKKLVAASGEQIRDLGEKKFSRQMRELRGPKQNECECCQTSHFNEKSSPSWKRCRAG